MDCSSPSLHVLHYLTELAQTHVCWIGDAIQLSHSLSSPSPPALSLSQYQGLFQCAGSSHQVAKVLELQLQHQSFQWILRDDSLGLTGLISLLSKGFSRVLLQHHSLKVSILCHSAFFTVQISHLYMTTRKTIALTLQTFVSKAMPLFFNTLPNRNVLLWIS